MGSHPRQPLTLGGVARFAGAPWTRLWLAQAGVGVLCAVLTAWFFHARIFPVIRQAISEIPSHAALVSGQLDWPGAQARILGENPWFAVIADLDFSGGVGQAADFQWEIGRHSDRLRSLLGYLDLPSRNRVDLKLDAVETLAWWNSLQPVALLTVSAGVLIFLGISWTGLALITAPVVRFLAFFLDRECSGSGAVKLAGAALLPGAIFLTGALFLYSLRWIPLIGLLAAFAGHMVIGWIYMAGAPFHLPRLESPGSSNPFMNRPS